MDVLGVHRQQRHKRYQMNGAARAGRWTPEEHAAFLTALPICGHDWKRVSRDYIPSRSAGQIRSHAQKYFLLKNRPAGERNVNGSFDDAEDDSDHRSGDDSGGVYGSPAAATGNDMGGVAALLHAAESERCADARSKAAYGGRSFSGGGDDASTMSEQEAATNSDLSSRSAGASDASFASGGASHSYHRYSTTAAATSASGSVSLARAAASTSTAGKRSRADMAYMSVTPSSGYPAMSAPAGSSTWGFPSADPSVVPASAAMHIAHMYGPAAAAHQSHAQFTQQYVMKRPRHAWGPDVAPAHAPAFAHYGSTMYPGYCVGNTQVPYMTPQVPVHAVVVAPAARASSSRGHWASLTSCQCVLPGGDALTCACGRDRGQSVLKL